MNSSTRPFLELNKVNKGYTLDGNAFTVLDDISFYLEKGDLLTILGPSGCGKSTLIRSICGLETIDLGKISIDGKEVYKTGSDRIMVFQDFNQLFPWKTVLENVVYPLKLNNLYNSNTERKERAEHFLQMVHLQDFLNAYPNQLSGGMRQRVAIARSLALNPKVLLMDEPFGALDAQTRAILQQEILNIWQETGTTIIFITHNIQESIILGSKITVLSKLPASIKLFIENEIPIPRLPETPEFMKLWHTLYGELDVKRF